MRRIEFAAPEFARALEATLCTHDARAYAEALLAAVALYRGLRWRLVTPGFVPHRDAEEAVMAHGAATMARLTR